MSTNLTKKELKSLKNALGRQGLTLDDQKNAEKTEIVQIDCFSWKNRENDGWQVGFGVEFHGVGVTKAQISSSSSENSSRSSEIAENAEESSGFDSDPPSDAENENAAENSENRRKSSESSENGQLLYGIDEKNENAEPILYVNRNLESKNVEIEGKSFETGELVATNRFKTPKIAESDEETSKVPSGYQIIGQFPISEDENEENCENFGEISPISPKSSGLWCNFEIFSEDLNRFAIPEEKLKTIPLDQEKLTQISAAMSNFSLPTPPGWEGVSDEKLIDFIRKRC